MKAINKYFLKMRCLSEFPQMRQKRLQKQINKEANSENRKENINDRKQNHR